MEWSDQAIILSQRPYGESAALVMLLSRDHGRHAGLVRGARQPRRRGELEPGTLVSAVWRARLAEHLGNLTLEPLRPCAAAWFDDPWRLAALVAACAVAEASLPERQPHPAVFEGLAAWLEALDSPYFGEAYVRWELGLLAELGFGLELGQCALSGVNDDLAYVSPRSGRAVSLSAGEPWRERLLALPRFLSGAGGGGGVAEVGAGLRLTGHFLARHALAEGALPAARQRLAERYAIGPGSAAPGSAAPGAAALPAESAAPAGQA